jgi:Zn-finger nucleic acid-binding protein
MHPAAVDLAKPCPACDAALDVDRDGANCRRCGGLFVAREHFGRPALPPVFSPSTRSLPCAICRHEMSPVLCGSVAAFSCARCRTLFFDGPRRTQLDDTKRAVVAVPARDIAKPSLVAVVSENAPRVGASALKLSFAAIVVAAIVRVVWMLTRA